MQPPSVVVLPVKPPAVGKSRLGSLPDRHRRRLAEAFALDTAAACLAAAAVHTVLAVTDDARLARELGGLGCTTMPDAGSGLNQSLTLAASEAGRRWPAAVPTAVCADLPSLRPEELDAALAASPNGAAGFVADSSGVGTTLYRAHYATFEPRFGPGSRAAHEASGAVRVGDDLTSLRLDVDDLDDLRAALTLGVGARTHAALEGLHLAG